MVQRHFFPDIFGRWGRSGGDMHFRRVDSVALVLFCHVFSTQVPNALVCLDYGLLLFRAIRQDS